MISRGSELFAKNIMNKVQEIVLSGRYSLDTCLHVIEAIGNVAGDSLTAREVFHTIEELYVKCGSLGTHVHAIDKALIKALVQVCLKSPVIMHETLQFLVEIECLDGLQLVSQRYLVPDEPFMSQIMQIIDRDMVEDERFLTYQRVQAVMIIANQVMKVGERASYTEMARQIIQRDEKVSKEIGEKCLEHKSTLENHKMAALLLLISLDLYPIKDLGLQDLENLYLQVAQSKKLRAIFGKIVISKVESELN